MSLKDKYFTISEAAKEADVTRQTISRWINQGKLKAEKIGRETLIEKELLNELIDSRISKLIFDLIVRKVTRIIRYKYRYEKKEKIEAFKTKSDPFAIGYNVERNDVTSDEVWVYISNFDISKDEPLLTFKVDNIVRIVKKYNIKRRGVV